jgi:hypothetical protein
MTSLNRRLAALAVLAAFAASPAGAADDDNLPNEGPWRIVLRDQLRTEKACELNEVLAFQEVPLGDDTGLDGHISCIDGREFNFTRKRKHQKFTIELCKPAVC